MPETYVSVDALVNAEIEKIVADKDETISDQAALIEQQAATIQAQAQEIEDLEEEIAAGGGEVAALPTVSVSDAPTLVEGGGSARFEISQLEPYNKPVSVPYTTEEGSAKAGTDFTTTAGTAVIPVGQVMVPVLVPVINDQAVEQTESFSLKIYSPYINVGLGRDTGTGTITDDDEGEPEPPQPSGDEPNASNTGSRLPDSQMPVYTGSNLISVANTIIEGKTINKALSITGRGCKLIDCKITGSGVWMIEADTGKDLEIGYCDIVPPNGTSQAIKAILAQGHMHHNDIRGMCIAITTKGGVSHIHHNYVHDLKSTPGSHFDCIFVAGDEVDTVIEFNSLTTPQQGGTANIFVATRWQNAHIIRPVVQDNWLHGKPSYSVYFEDTDVANIVDAKFLRNKIERGTYGYYTITGCVVQKQDNVDIFTGAPI